MLKVHKQIVIAFETLTVAANSVEKKSMPLCRKTEAACPNRGRGSLPGINSDRRKSEAQDEVVRRMSLSEMIT